ncbi:MAG: hypothetical protein KJ858_06370, partial [Nanoarchaeota archaeon]|nr:hypothetical protein [Nanoarchaeota archaeon]
MLIGKALPGGSGESDFDGDIDEFRIYSKALSLEEIVGLSDTNADCGNNVTEVGEVCDYSPQWCDFSGGNGTQHCNEFCNGFSACGEGVCGDGVLNDGEECDDGNTVEGDGCSAGCVVEDRFWSMVVMSDGDANEMCDEQSTGNPRQDAVEAAREACEEHGIITYAVGFGDGADQDTLIAIAEAGCNGSYYYSDASSLLEVYEQIASDIIMEYVEQTLVSYGGAAPSRLYPDSYIDFDYGEEGLPYGLIITAESMLNESESGGSFVVPPESTSLGAHIVSYSGPSWTSKARANENVIFDLSSYGVDYR